MAENTLAVTLEDRYGNLIAMYANMPADTVVTINGIRYSGELFMQFAETLPVGRLFSLARREDGVITIMETMSDGQEV